MSNGVIFYRGPSRLDGKPIVGIATGLAKASNNAKTGGGLIQTWILRSDIDPVAATHSGDDASICGACPHRGDIVDGRNVNRSCYVTVFQAPLNIYKSMHRGIYPETNQLVDLFADRGVRLGAYGDPAAIPFSVWERMTRKAKFHTGYTHQWRTFPEFNALCMASCDTVQEAAHAEMLGYRIFRIRKPGEAALPYEVVCPASEEAGKKLTCDMCRACGGNKAKARANIVITAHGAVGKVNAIKRRELTDA